MFSVAWAHTGMFIVLHVDFEEKIYTSLIFFRCLQFQNNEVLILYSVLSWYIHVGMFPDVFSFSIKCPPLEFFLFHAADGNLLYQTCYEFLIQFFKLGLYSVVFCKAYRLVSFNADSIWCTILNNFFTNLNNLNCFQKFDNNKKH